MCSEKADKLFFFLQNHFFLVPQKEKNNIKPTIRKLKPLQNKKKINK